MFPNIFSFKSSNNAKNKDAGLQTGSASLNQAVFKDMAGDGN